MDEPEKLKAEDILSSSDDLMNGSSPPGEQQRLAENIKHIVSASGNETLDHKKKVTIWNHIISNLPQPVATPKKARIIGINKWTAAAASVLLLLSFGIYLRLHHLVPVNKQVIVQSPKGHHHEILPGSNKAVLTLANGAHIVLDSAKNGLLARQGDTKIQKTAEGQIAYNLNTGIDQPIQMNSISTPCGGQYQVILPDGTKAWLNAASSLQFPTAFTGEERNVKMTGEVYFEVAKNKRMPFKVNVNGAIVEVLGTHFDIKAYGDEKEMKTTLLEGSVKVSKSTTPVILVPGQQALLNYSSGVIQVQQANIEVVMGWKKGIFIFKKENIKSILRDVSRWYDVDIAYEVGFVDQDFTGGISRFKNISEVLNLLELTEDVHFKIEGRRVTVMP